ncbi:MAG TPA: hypothetical protein VMW41_03855 [Candidatus Bathyarchaeia archaeon]|nr:hypothetical protein [Candidatus Bathyarchaeia archaeon]
MKKRKYLFIVLCLSLVLSKLTGFKFSLLTDCSCQAKDKQEATLSTISKKTFQDEITFTATPSVFQSKDTAVSTSVNLDSMNEFRHRLETRVTSLEKKIQSREAFQKKIAEKTRIKIEKLFNKMIDRFEHATLKIRNILLKIESRLVKIEDNNPNANTGEIRERINLAREKIIELENAIQKTKASLDIILKSEKPEEDFALVVDLLKEVKNNLIEIRQLLMEIVQDLKSLLETVNPSTESE